jgi:hypothetical protein
MQSTWKPEKIKRHYKRYKKQCTTQNMTIKTIEVNNLSMTLRDYIKTPTLVDCTTLTLSSSYI